MTAWLAAVNMSTCTAIRGQNINTFRTRTISHLKGQWRLHEWASLTLKKPAFCTRTVLVHPVVSCLVQKNVYVLQHNSMSADCNTLDWYVGHWPSSQVKFTPSLEAETVCLQVERVAVVQNVVEQTKSLEQDILRRWTEFKILDLCYNTQ